MNRLCECDYDKNNCTDSAQDQLDLLVSFIVFIERYKNMLVQYVILVNHYNDGLYKAE